MKRIYIYAIAAACFLFALRALPATVTPGADDSSVSPDPGAMSTREDTHVGYCYQAAAGPSIQFPGMSSAIQVPPCSTARFASTDICSNVPGGVACLNGAGQWDPSMIPTMTVTGSSTASGTGTNNFLPKWSTYTATSTATGTQTSTATSTTTYTETVTNTSTQTLTALSNSSVYEDGSGIWVGTSGLWHVDTAGYMTSPQKVCGHAFAGGDITCAPTDIGSPAGTGTMSGNTDYLTKKTSAGWGDSLLQDANNGNIVASRTGTGPMRLVMLNPSTASSAWSGAFFNTGSSSEAGVELFKYNLAAGLGFGIMNYDNGPIYLGTNGLARLRIDPTGLLIYGSSSGSILHGTAATTASYSMLDPSTAPAAGQAVAYPSGGGQGVWFTPLAGNAVTCAAGSNTFTAANGQITACSTTSYATFPASSAGWLHDNGSGTRAWTTPTAAQVGALAPNAVNSTCTKPTFSGGQATSCASATYSDVGALSSSTTHLSGDVPTSTTVCGHALSSNVSCTTSDIGAVATSSVSSTPAASRIPVSDGSATLNSWVTHASGDLAKSYGLNLRSISEQISSGTSYAGVGAWNAMTYFDIAPASSETVELSTDVTFGNVTNPGFAQSAGNTCCFRITVDTVQVSKNYTNCNIPNGQVGTGDPLASVHIQAYTSLSGGSSHRVRIEGTNIHGVSSDLCVTPTSAISTIVREYGSL